MVTGALESSERFESLATLVQRLEARLLLPDEQVWFSERTLGLRYPDLVMSGVQPSALLACRRYEDRGDDLWSVLNRVQLWGAPHNWIYVDGAFMWSNGGSRGSEADFGRAGPHN